jgi:anti-sigma factor RsiW
LSSCPDDDRLSLFLEGRLPGAERAQLELHLDRCGTCTQLVAELGKIYGQAGDSVAPPGTALGHGAPRGAPASKPGARAQLPPGLLTLHLAVGLAESLVALKLLRLLGAIGPIAERNLDSAWLGTHWRSVSGLLLAWALLLGLGGTLSLLTGAGLALGRAWALGAARLHAWVVLPTVLFTPLGAFLLWTLSPEARRRSTRARQAR